jgi:microcin C transport system substrate-binding protein
MRPTVLSALLATVATLAVACGSSTPEQTPTAAARAGGASSEDRAYPAFPDPDTGADPGVSAAQGGRGFTGEGWETNTAYGLVGDPRAVKGGTLRIATMTEFPATLRYYGPGVPAWNQTLHSLVYESLVGLHPTTLEWIPGLATHWQVSADKLTFRFRIDPNARFSDGTPVTSNDVIASWRLTVDKGLQDPARLRAYSAFEEPVAESRYLVSVRARTIDWQNFVRFAGLHIYPAHVLRTTSGEQYLRNYDYRMFPGTGPYMVSEQEIQQGKMLTIRRRTDYWAERHRRNVGTANFDQIQQIVVRDRNEELEQFREGDLDVYVVNRARMWVEDLDYPNMTRGLNQKRKIFNHHPQGIQGVAINTRRPPLDDGRVRKALRHLFNREAMVETLLLNEYVLVDSMFPGSVYENPKNERIRYDPKAALGLLAAAGWSERDAQGRLIKDGRPLNLTIDYVNRESERIFTQYREDLRRVGITLDLRQVTFDALVQQLDERAFSLASVGYPGQPFPDLSQSWLSRLADEKYTNNITGFKNPRADQIIEAYSAEFDFERRITLLREFDDILTNEHHWILEWNAPFERLAYWNRFGQPPGYLSRFGDYHDIMTLWWLDPARSGQLDAALKSPGATMGVGQTDDRHWLDSVQIQAQR